MGKVGCLKTADCNGLQGPEVRCRLDKGLIRLLR